jgi:hypothetical protein
VPLRRCVGGRTRRKGHARNQEKSRE